MSSFFMRLSRRFVSVDFNEYKAARIIELLNDIKSRYSCFLNARLRILDSCLTERLNEFGFYVDVYMNY